MNAWAKRVLGVGALVFAMTASGSARAELDRFGTGDGHGGAYTAAASGEVLNTYAPLAVDAPAGAESLSIGTAIGAASGFAAGDLVLVWRATGLDDAAAPSGSNARVSLTNNAVGSVELARVSSVDGTTLYLGHALVNAFSKDVTQVVKVPELTSVSVPAGTSVVAAPWQAVGSGYAGGIVAFLAQGTVTVEGRLDASQAGFRGGVAIERPLNALLAGCPDNDGTVANGYAPKGEGIANASYSTTGSKGGRGNRSLAGGGGNCFENGGAGGGNHGHGGPGGVTVIGALLGTNRSGIGGAGVDYSLLSRLSLGGGGGAGEEKDGLGSGGGAGGGAVFVRGRSLAGAGVIAANGETAANARLLGLLSDGAGGGGAGGSIVLRMVDQVSCGSLEAHGGKGGNSNVIGINVFGPGGGGAGGRVFVQSKNGGACTTNVKAGLAGTSGLSLLRQGAGPTSETDPDAIGIVEGIPATVPVDGLPVPVGPDGFCWSNDVTYTNCTIAHPVCDAISGFCVTCNGSFGSGAARACGPNSPICNADGSCNPCDGDYGTTTTNACGSITNPWCPTTGPTAGKCATCASDPDCAGNHKGPYCNVTAGACGPRCTDDSQCAAADHCSDGICIPRPDDTPTDGGTSDAGVPHKTPNSAQVDGGADPLPGEDGSTIAGGGCGCKTANSTSSIPLFGLLALAFSALLRRRVRKAGGK